MPLESNSEVLRRHAQYVENEFPTTARVLRNIAEALEHCNCGKLQVCPVHGPRYVIED